MSSIALGAAFASVQLVYQAYSKVKTNKARCARLVDRCQMVVDRLQRVTLTNDDDEALQQRIRQLEYAFEYTANTILQVGQQSIVASLLQSGNDALRIDTCNETLTELVALFNLEEVVDVHRWQREFEAARVRDHEELSLMGQRLESGNAAIARELAQQGTTINEVYNLVQNISASLHDTSVVREPLTIQVPPPFSVAASSPTSSRPSSSCSSSANTAMTSPSTSPVSSESSAATKVPKPPTLRRLSWANCVKMSPLSTVFSKLSSPSRPRSADSSKSFDSKISSRSISSENAPPTPLYTSPLSGSTSPTPGCSLDLPPPYQLHVVNPSSEDGNSAVDDHDDEEVTTLSHYTSVEAIRAPDSPVPSLSSAHLGDTVFASTENVRLPRRRRTNSTVEVPALRHKRPIEFSRSKTVSCVRPNTKHHREAERPRLHRNQVTS